MSQITITNDGQRVAKTSKAFGVTITKELMRAYTVSASFLNNDSARQYINSTSMFEVDGQKYDITGFKQNSGSNNITQINADHVGYRLNQYLVPEGYAFTGTVQQIVQDILNTSGANVEFSVSACAAISGSFTLNNTQPVTARSALFALKALGVEVNFDNFTLYFPGTVGTGHSKVFAFGKDLCDFNRTWDKDNGATYDISIANLQRLAGHEEETFDVGDTCIVKDSFVGDEISKRIISYTKCLDDPTQDTVTLGVFVRDSADDSVAMKMNISAAQEKSDASVQVGESYNNVDITHEFGFRSMSADGLLRTFQNGTDGYVIQHLVNSAWKTVWQVTSTDGNTAAYSDDGTLKVVMGGAVGFALYKSDGAGGWILVSKLDADGLQSAKLRTMTSSVYGTVGNLGNGKGFALKTDGEASELMGIYADFTEDPLGGFTIWNGWDAMLLSYKEQTILQWSESAAGSGGKYTQLVLKSDSIQLVINGIVKASWVA